ncbi:hypothetical protein D3C76_1318720 [compost metagenome]
MGGGAFALQQARRTKHQRTSAHGRDVFRLGGLPLDEGQRLLVFHQGPDAGPAGNADHVELRAVLERGSGQQHQPGAGSDRRQVLPDQVDLHVWQRGQYVIRAGQVQLLDLGE